MVCVRLSSSPWFECGRSAPADCVRVDGEVDCVLAQSLLLLNVAVETGLVLRVVLRVVVCSASISAATHFGHSTGRFRQSARQSRLSVWWARVGCSRGV